MKKDLTTSGKAYRIVDWAVLYEVNSGGKKAAAGTPIKMLKKRPLDYVRWKVNGHKLGAGYRTMMERGGNLGPGMDLAVLGLFGKLIELAGDQGAELRGWILDNHGEPIDAEQIKYIIFANNIDIVKRGLEILSSPAVGWIERVEFEREPAEFRQAQREPAEFRQAQREPAETGGDQPTLLNVTETETEEILKQKQTEASVSEIKTLNSRVSVSMLRVAELLGINPSNKSDLTTLRGIFDQLKDQIGDGTFAASVLAKIESKATMCKGRQRAIAIFVAAAKEQFGYVPAGRRILRRKYEV